MSEPHYERKGLAIYQGSCTDVLPTLPEKSVHCVVTSPPYWGLRDYGADGQLGLEPTPEEYVANMVAVFREVRRVLRDDGTLWLNMGDCYAGNPHYAGHHTDGHALTQDGHDVGVRKTIGGDGLKPKDLVGQPWRLAFALQADGWYLRSDIIWAKPNPMPESVTDRPTKSHEYIFLLTKSARYFYDADAVREASIDPESFSGRKKRNQHAFETSDPDKGRTRIGFQKLDGQTYPERNLRDVWTVATHPFPGAHFATFPPKLIEPCIKAGTSERGCCPECGAPWVREVERASSGDWSGRPGSNGDPTLPNKNTGKDAVGGGTTTGFRPTCDHGHEPVPCTVLDPFWGAGTVGVVAQNMNCHAIGIELNPEYIDMSVKRLAQGVLF